MRTGRAGFPFKWMLPLAACLGVALGVLPALASSETAPTVKAVETGLYTYGWSPSEATISPSGQVTFANSTPGVPHGIVWTGTVKPSCDASVPDGEGGKELSSSTSWSGSCTFATAGTYSFHCYVHAYMTGTVTVAGPTTTTTTTTGAGGGTETTTSTNGTPPPAGEQPSPLSGVVSQALKLPRSQRGAAVRGTIAISQAGAGGRIEVDLFASRASLAKASHSTAIRVGHLTRSSLVAGRLSFSVSLNRLARTALRRHRRLGLVVKIAVTPAGGRTLRIDRSIVQHA